ncbi:MAG: hypothetical protein OXI55_14860 [Gammaproteobacteria bacterium]|nr:hypothetical protein [Gammaproteobacteria bacterium]
MTYPVEDQGKLAAMVPMVTITIPADVTADPNATPPVAGVDHSGSAEIKLSLSGGAEFAGTIGTLMWNQDSSGTTVASAPSNVATITDGGRDGDTSVTLMIGEHTTGGRAGTNTQLIFFELPALKKLGGLSGAKPPGDEAEGVPNVKDGSLKQVTISGSSKRLSGAFTDGALAQTKGGEPVIKAVNAVTVAATGTGDKDIVIDGDNAFRSIKQADPKTGYVHLATVTITNIDEYDTGEQMMDDDTTADVDESEIDILADIYDRDGEVIDNGLRGTVNVMATGTRGLFNESDRIYIDYDASGTPGEGESLNMEIGMLDEGLSNDSDDAGDAFKDGVGTFMVYYKAGGEEDINHGSMINLKGLVSYSDPAAIDEAAAMTSTTLNFEGVTTEVKAYAIPFEGNGKGDTANVRVRCESGVGDMKMCRVFLECWDDMGMRGFGEAGMIAENSVEVWKAADVEMVTGVKEAMSRHSCRLLSRGAVSVQQLTRDGNSGTLVNNTYVGG